MLVVFRGYFFLFMLLPFCIVLGMIIYQRFFKEIKTNLRKEENIFIIKEIADKQNSVYESQEVYGIYLFEINLRNDTEYIILICVDNYIFINNFYNRRLYNLYSKSINALEKLILTRADVLSKKRLSSKST